MAPAANGRILFRRIDQVSMLKGEITQIQKIVRKAAARDAELINELQVKKSQLVVAGQEREMAKGDMVEQVAQAKQETLEAESRIGFEELETAECEAFYRVTDLRGRNIPGEFFHLWVPCDGQDVVFKDVQDLIKSALNGYNVSIIFYGETGSGKTYSMIGGNETDSGLLPRAVSFMLEQRKLLSSSGWQYTFSVNCYEVYIEQFIDLFDMKAAQIPRFTDGILDNSCFRTETIDTREEVMFLIRGIQDLRTSASTELNRSSSRSHCIFPLNIGGISNARGNHR